MYFHAHTHGDNSVVQIQVLARMCASVPKLPPLSLWAHGALATLRLCARVRMRVHALVFLRPDANF